MGSSIHSDTDDALPIAGKRFERSPFHDCYAAPETVYGVYAGRFYPVGMGEDRAAKYAALRERAVLYDVPERPVEISGPDAVAFLERIFCRRVGTLKEGRGRYAVALTPRGGVFMDGVLFRLGESRFWYVQPDGALETWIEAWRSGYDITVSDPRSRVLQIQGPASRAVMAAASDGAIGEDMKYFHAGFFELGGQRVYVSRTGWTGELGYEVYTLGEATDAPRLWDHLLAAGEPHGLEVSAIPSMEVRRIEAGILDNGTDMDWTMTPWQAGLGAFVDAEKEGFVGREAALAADRDDLRLFGLTCAGAEPAMGWTVSLDGEAVGRVTAGSWSPALDTGIALVRMDRKGDWAGRAVTLSDGQGGRHDAAMTTLPFYDAQKRIPRGLPPEG